MSDSESQPYRLKPKFYLAWFIFWSGISFVVLGTILGTTHGEHISTNFAVLLAAAISLFVGTMATLGYWMMYTSSQVKKKEANG